MNWFERAQNIKAIVTDIDGVLTDGTVGYGCNSPVEIKFFNIKDGFGVVMAHQAGLKVCSLSGRSSATNRTRLTELKFDIIQEGCKEKASGLRQVAAELGIAPENCMYLGDEHIDLPAMAICGIAVAPADAAPVVRELADWVTDAKGGHGCVREAIEKLLHYQGKLDGLLQPLYDLFQERPRG